MSTNIRFKRSSVPGKVPSLDSIDLGELAINSADGKLFTKQSYTPTGASTALSKIVEIGATAVDNVLYVATSGDDTNSGKTLGQSFLTLKKALSVATPGTTIYLKSGEYIEDNPLMVPARVAIIGDSLRTTTIRPANPTLDICWVNNGSYISQLNFKGHVAPAAAVAFPPDGSAGYIVTSPYVQAVTSITTTGTGMRVDGSLVEGLKSMVVDAYTQYNQGGIGIHMLNRGYTQLVSVFTICTDIAILCEDGGFCSVTNSNSSFGNFGLVSVGASEPLYYGTVQSAGTGGQIVFKNLNRRPNIADGVLFANYNQATCKRDNGLIVDSLAFDLLYNGTTQTTFAGLSYWGKDSVTIPGEVTQTLAALNRAKAVATDVVLNDTVTPTAGNTTPQVFDLDNPGSIFGSRLVEDEFSIITNIIENGPSNSTLILGPDLDQGEAEYRVLREQILNKKTEIQQATINYINNTFVIQEYDEAKCYRDTGLIIDAVAYDMALNTNYQSITAGDAYLRANASDVRDTVQKAATLQALEFVKAALLVIATGNATAISRLTTNMDIVIDILDTGSVSIPALSLPPSPTSTGNQTNARLQLQQNKEFIKEEVLAYVNANSPPAAYDQARCKRDVGYIVDALSYDIIYGGNWATYLSAEAYWVGATSQLGAGEKAATLAAYTRLQTVVSAVVQGNAVTPTVTLINTQITSGGSATGTEATALSNLIEVIKDVIDDGLGELPVLSYPSLSGIDSGLATVHTNILAARTTIQNDTVQDVNNNKFQYDEAKCYRDVGLIIDAVALDLVFGSNYQSVKAGLTYRTSTGIVIPTNTKTQTIAAIEFAKDQVAVVVDEDPVAQTFVNGRFDDIITILDTGVAPETTYPGTFGLDQDILDAVAILKANRDFIVAETLEYIDQTYPSLIFSTSTCGRDIGYVLDALAYDLVYGGNSQTVDAARRYYSYATGIKELDSDEFEATVDAYGFVQLLSQRVIINDAILAIQNTEAQVLNLDPSNQTQVTALGRLFAIFIATIQKEIVGSTDFIVPNGKRMTTTALVNTYNLLQANKQFIEDEVIAFVAATYPGFTYDESKCRRDVNFIIDSVSFDIIHGGNRQAVQSGVYYYDFNADVSVIPTQTTQTIGALTYLKELISQVVTCDPTPNPWQTVVDQNVSLPPATSAEALALRNKIDLLIEILEEGPINVEDSTERAREAISLTASSDANVIKAFNLLVANRKFIQTELVEYINQNWYQLSNGELTFTSVVETSELTLGTIPTVLPSIDLQNSALKAIRSAILADLEDIQTEVLAFLAESFFDNFVFDKVKCYRDVGTIIESVLTDMVFGSNYKTVTAGLAYLRSYSSEVLDSQKVQTIAGINAAKDIVLAKVVNAQAKVEIASRFDIIVKILEEETNTTTIVYPAPDAQNSDTVNAFNILRANKAFIQDEIIAYANENFDLTGYDSAKCARDTGFIIDAVSYDMMFGSNFRSIIAAKAYFRGTTGNNTVVGVQKQATIEAYKYLKSLLVDLVKSDPASEVAVKRNMDIIITVLENGVSAAPAYIIPNPVGYADAFRNARDLLDANRAFIIAETIQYITEEYVGFEADPCSRDIGFILDALYYDITYGGNLETLVAGLAYYEGTTLQLGAGEAVPTLAAYAFMRDLIGDVVQNIPRLTVPDVPGGSSAEPLLQTLVPQVRGFAGSSGAAAALESLVDVIRTIIDEGPDEAPAAVLPSTSWVNANLVTSFNLLQAEKETVKTQVIDFVNENFVNFDYDQVKCRRDMGYIIDAASYDLLYGGNVETIVAGQAYFDGAVQPQTTIPGEIIQTVAAYDRYKDIVVDIVRNVAVTPSTGNTTPQVTNLTIGGVAAAAKLAALVDILNDIIKGGPKSAPAKVNPTFSLGDQTFANVRTSLLAYIAELQAETLDFIESRLLQFNKDKCKRDVGLILDAVCYDLVFGGNFQSILAGNAYRQAASEVVYTYQLGPTLAAINFIKDKAIDIAGANQLAVARLTNSFFIIYDILENGLEATPIIRTPAPVGASANAVNAAKNIRKNIEFLKEEVVAYISANYKTYDTSRCSRDLGFMIDAVLYDLIFDTNYNSIKAGAAYLRSYSAPVLEQQKVETIGGITYAESLVLAAMTDAVTSTENNAAYKAKVSAGFAIIKAFINDGNANAAPALSMPDGGFDAADDNAKDILLANKEFIKAEVIAYVNDNYNVLVYDEELCARDTGLIIDAVIYDMVTDTDYQTKVAAEAYLRGYTSAGNVSTGFQKIATIRALEYVKDRLLALAVGNATAISRLTANMDLIIGVIDDGVSVYSSIDFGDGPTGVSANRVNAKNQLQANRAFIQAEIVAWINQRIADSTAGSIWNGFTYDSAACSRDIGFIVDALTYDVLYGGRWATDISARAYFTGANVSLIPGEAQQTEAAYVRLKEVVAQIVQEITVVESPSNGESQDTTFGAATIVEATIVADNVQFIIDAIREGGLGEPPTSPYPDLSWANSGLRAVFTAVQNAKPRIQVDIIEYVNTAYLDFDQAKCSRDVGFIIDAIANDLALGSNFNSIIAGTSYLRSYSSGVLAEPQRSATIAALQFVKTAILAVTAVDASTTAEASVAANMDLIIEIITDGVFATIPAVVLPTPTGYNTSFLEGYGDARDLILANRNFLKAELLQFISINYPTLNYDSEVCLRDVDYIIDSLRYDLTYGGNTQSIISGQAYYVGATLTLGAGEKAPTLAAYNYLKTLVLNVAQNLSVTPLQTDVARVTGTAGTLTAAEAAAQLIEDIRTIINNPAETPATVQPSFTWVASGLQDARTGLLNDKSTIQTNTLTAVNATRTDDYIVYSEATCARDVGYILDSIAYDLTYGGNGQSIDAGLQYYYKGSKVIPAATTAATIDAIERIKTVAALVVLNTSVTPTAGNTETQVTNLTAGDAGSVTRVESLADIILDILGSGPAAAPALVAPTLDVGDSSVNTKVQTRLGVLDKLATIQAATITYINETYQGFGYSQELCKRDVGFILNGVIYDLIYDGNSQTKYAAEQYFGGGVLRITDDERSATVAAYAYLDMLVQKIIVNTSIMNLQNFVDQDISTPAATTTEVNKIKVLFDAATDILANGYTCLVTLDASFRQLVVNGVRASFHQVSTISASSHTFEFMGSGTDINAALPYNGGRPIFENQIVSQEGGFIAFTSTDEKGDFRIGTDLTIERASGSIVGRAFNKSLLGVMTPYILALEGG
jgi:hypothetical protein